MQAYRLASFEPPQPPIRAISLPAPPSVSNDVYYPISLDTLIEISPEDIQIFRDYLRSIPFCYNDPTPSILGRQLVTEGDVRMFFNSSVLLAVWPVALAMVPKVRTADLVLTSEKTYEGVYSSRPDASIIAYNATPQPTAIGQIEYKGPQALEAFKNVIRAVSEGRSIMTPTSWDIVTRQLRKFATVTKCRSILCSDGSDAYIFVFPTSESSDGEEVHFLWSSKDRTGSLTLREAVLFLAYLGIKLSSPFSHRYVYTHLCPTCRVCYFPIIVQS
jgi:hypothetical protein